MTDKSSDNDTSAMRHYYKHNRLQQLRGFCYAAQTGSISKAAERMYLSQPSVSLQIQALERELSVVLFERRGPKIKLTPEGQVLYELALPLVEGLETLPENSPPAAARSNPVSSTSPPASPPCSICCLASSTASRINTRASTSTCTTSPAATAWRCCGRMRSTSQSAPCSTCPRM